MGHKRPNDPTPAIRRDARELARHARTVQPELRNRLAVLRTIHSTLIESREQAVARRDHDMAGDHYRWARVYRLVIADVLVAMREVDMAPAHTAVHPAIR